MKRGPERERLPPGVAASSGGTRRRLVFACGPFLLLPQLARGACSATRSDALGPFYIKDAPLESDLCAAAGENERLAVAGRVLGAPDCKPLADASIEVWQADGRGEYSQVSRERKDDARCLLRATLKSGADGRYAFRTILPGEYPGRPRHIHYRISRSGYRTLVTQLYFAPERGIDAARIAKVIRGEAGGSTPREYQATFDITLERA